MFACVDAKKEDGRGAPRLLMNMMKRKLIVLVALLVCMLTLCASAMAATDPLKVNIQLSENTFVAPQQITVSIQVQNTGDADLPSGVKLFDPNGSQIEEFGEPVLNAGTSKSWNGTWDVTQEQLESGYITYSLQYAYVGDDGEVIGKEKRYRKPIQYEGAVASVEVNRIITPTTAHNGQEVTIVYDVVNTGTMEITNVEIKEDKSISSKTKAIERIPAGEKASVTFTVTMGKKNLTSKPTISYTAGGKTEKLTKDSATIKYGELYLNASLAADKKGGQPGDHVKLTLTLKNTGKTDYTDVSVTDDVLGDVFSGQTVPAGKTVTLERDVVMSETTDYLFTVRGTDADGNAVETTTSRVTLTAVSADQVVHLSVRATADSEVVYELPSIVKFKVYVTNESSFDLKNVSVSASGKTLYTFPTIEAGETRDFTRDVSIQMGGKYQFVATARDQLNQTQTFESNIIQMYQASPTAAPTAVPIIAPVEPHYQALPTEVDNQYEDLQNTLSTVMLVLAALTAIGLLLVIVALVRRGLLAADAKKAIEQFAEPSVRNYNVQAAADAAADEANAEEKAKDEDVKA